MTKFKTVLAALASGLVASASASVMLATAGPAMAQAPRDASAEAYVQTEASRGLQILRIGGAGEKAAFRAFVDQIADVSRITRFVLGKYARSADPAQYQAFATAFRTYANGVYESRFSDYKGQTLKVTGSIVRQPGDVVVTSEVRGSGAAQPVSWRLLRSGSGWKVVDVQVAGVWLAITEQQDFVSTLDNNRGDLGVLTRQLQSQNASGATRG